MKTFICLMLSLVFFSSCLSSKSNKTYLKFGSKKSASSSPSASSAPLEQSGLVVRMSDRYYVASLLKDVFGQSAEAIVNNYVSSKMDSFGGGCDQYDKSANGICSSGDCSSVACTGINIINNQVGVSSVIRQGWTIRACEEITENDNSVLHAIQMAHDDNSISGANVPAPTTATLKKAYGLFYRSIPPNDNIISSLSKISANETSNFEKWRYILLGICTTSEWQIP